MYVSENLGLRRRRPSHRRVRSAQTIPILSACRLGRFAVAYLLQTSLLFGAFNIHPFSWFANTRKLSQWAREHTPANLQTQQSVSVAFPLHSSCLWIISRASGTRTACARDTSITTFPIMPSKLESNSTPIPLATVKKQSRQGTRQ